MSNDETREQLSGIGIVANADAVLAITRRAQVAALRDAASRFQSEADKRANATWGGQPCWEVRGMGEGYEAAADELRDRASALEATECWVSDDGPLPPRVRARPLIDTRQRAISSDPIAVAKARTLAAIRVGDDSAAVEAAGGLTLNGRYPWADPTAHGYQAANHQRPEDGCTYCGYLQTRHSS